MPGVPGVPGVPGTVLGAAPLALPGFARGRRNGVEKPRREPPPTVAGTGAAVGAGDAKAKALLRTGSPRSADACGFSDDRLRATFEDAAGCADVGDGRGGGC